MVFCSSVAQSSTPPWRKPASASRSGHRLPSSTVGSIGSVPPGLFSRSFLYRAGAQRLASTFQRPIPAVERATRSRATMLVNPAMLDELRRVLERYDVAYALVFGSAVRGQLRSASDVDIAV